MMNGGGGGANAGGWMTQISSLTAALSENLTPGGFGGLASASPSADGTGKPSAEEERSQGAEGVQPFALFGASTSSLASSTPTSTYDEAMVASGGMIRRSSSSNLFRSGSRSSSNSSISTYDRDSGMLDPHHQLHQHQQWPPQSPAQLRSTGGGVMSSVDLSPMPPLFSAAGFSSPDFSATARGGETSSHSSLSVLARSGVAGGDTGGELPLAKELATQGHLSGHMHKLGVNVRKWKRRFFVLQPTTMLYYYLSSGDSEPAGVINMDIFSEVEEVDDGEFTSSSSSSSSSSSPDEPNNGLNEEQTPVASHDRGDGSSPGAAPTAQPLPLPPPPTGHPAARGFLMNQRRRRRLQNNEQLVNSTSTTAHALRLRRPDTGEEVVLHAPCAEDRSRWVEALSTLRFKNQQNTINALRAEVAEHEERIRSLESDSRSTYRRHNKTWRALDNERDFRESFSKRFNAVADAIELSLGLRKNPPDSERDDSVVALVGAAAQDGEVGSSAGGAGTSETDTDAPGNGLTPSQQPLFGANEDLAESSNDAVERLPNTRKPGAVPDRLLLSDGGDASTDNDEGYGEAIDGDGGSEPSSESPFVIKGVRSSGRNNSEEGGSNGSLRAKDVKKLPGDHYEVRMSEQGRDLRVLERFTSLSRTLNDALLKSRDDAGLLRSKLGNLAKHVRGLERREADNASKLSSALESISGLKQEKKLLVKEIRRLREVAVLAAQERDRERERELEAREARETALLMSHAAASGSATGAGAPSTIAPGANPATSAAAASAAVAAAASATSAALAKSGTQQQRDERSVGGDAAKSEPVAGADQSGDTSEAELTYDARLFRRELRAAIHNAIEMARPDNDSQAGVAAAFANPSTGSRRGSDNVMTSWLLPPGDVSALDSITAPSALMSSQLPSQPASSRPAEPPAPGKAVESESVLPEPEGMRAKEVSATPTADTASGYFESLGSSIGLALGLASSVDALKSPGRRSLMAPFSGSMGEGANGIGKPGDGDLLTKKREAIHETGHFEYKVVYQGGVGLRHKPDCVAPITRNVDSNQPNVLLFQKCFVASERLCSPDDGVVYVRLDASHDLNCGMVGWVFEKTLNGMAILERGAIQRVDSHLNLDAIDSDDASGSEHPWDSPRRSRDLDGTSTDCESAEEGPNNGTDGSARGGIGDDRGDETTFAAPIDSWEVVFHAKKIGIQFKQGSGGRIVVSKLSELVLFGTQRMPRVGAVLVACNGQYLHGLSWKQVAQQLKATGRPLRLRFAQDTMGDDAPPLPPPPLPSPQAAGQTNDIAPGASAWTLAEDEV